MKNILSIFLLCICTLFIFTSCSGKKKTKIEINPDEIVSIAVSGYPIIFANGDSIDTTTDINKITNITNTFNEVTLEYYKSKEEWEQISPDGALREQASITFYDSKKKCVECLSKVTNTEGSFIIKQIGNEVYIASNDDYDKLSSIYDILIKEAEDGILDN